MTIDTEALRAQFERRMNLRGWPEANIRRDGLDYSSTQLTEAWHAFQAGYAAAKAETVDEVAKERDYWQKELHALLEAADAVATNNAHAASSGAVRYAKDSQTWEAYASLDKARQRAGDAIRAGVKEPSDEARPPGAVVDEQAAQDVLAERQRQIAAEGWEGEPFGYFRAEPFGWTDCAEGDEGAVALYEKAGVTDATLHKIIASVEAALDAAGAPAGTLVERIGALAEDAARWRFSVADGGNQRMSWLDVYDDWDGDGNFTAAIDAARTKQEAG